MQPPCKDCPDRHLHCHSECDKYANYYIANEQRKKNIREEKLSWSYTFECMAKKQTAYLKRVSKNGYTVKDIYRENLLLFQ